MCKKINDVLIYQREYLYICHMCGGCHGTEVDTYINPTILWWYKKYWMDQMEIKGRWIAFFINLSKIKYIKKTYNEDWLFFYYIIYLFITRNRTGKIFVLFFGHIHLTIILYVNIYAIEKVLNPISNILIKYLDILDI